MGSGGLVFLCCRIDAAGESQFGNVEFVFQQLIDDLDHAFHRHRFFCDDQATFRVSGGKFRLEGGSLHLVGGSAVPDTLFFVDFQNHRQQGVILPQDQGVVKVLQQIPCGFLNLIAGKTIFTPGLTVSSTSMVSFPV